MTEYPLEQLVEIKQKRVDDAEKLLVEKKELLATEEKKLKACIDKAEATQKHYNEKLDDFYSSFEGEGTTSGKVNQIKDHLKSTLERLAEEKKAVEKQRAIRDEAQKVVDEAKALLNQRRIDLKKLTEHREVWQKEYLQEKKRLAIIEHDELGSAIHSQRKRERKGKR